MNRFVSGLALLSALTLVAGCATEETVGGASVTRFHLGQPIARGPIAVEAADPRDTNGLEFSHIAASVARELTRLGWTVVPNGASEQVAMVSVTQQAHPGARRAGSPSASAAAPAATGAWRRRRRRRRRHSGRRRRRSDRRVPARACASSAAPTRTVAWEGRGQTDARAGTPLRRRAAAVESSRPPCFRTSPENRAALSGSAEDPSSLLQGHDDPFRFERLRRRQHSPGRHRGRPHRP